MRNVKGKAITYHDWLRVAARYESFIGRDLVLAWLEENYLNPSEEVSFPESKLFGIIWT
jgi:hypothetical protein